MCQVPEYIRIGIQQRVLAVAADVQRVVSPLQRLLRRAKAEQDRTSGPDTWHDQPDRADSQDSLSVLVRRPQATRHRENYGIQIHMVQEVGQLQAGHIPAVPDRLPDTQVPPPRRARVCFVGGKRV